MLPVNLIAFIAVNGRLCVRLDRNTPMNELTPIQARILGCLMEKEETTPDQYPLTLNALRNACNQKTSRNPVSTYSEGEVGHAIRELEQLGLVREDWGSRAPRYRHLANKELDLHRKGKALMCVLMLRGPQTLGELKTHTLRLFPFDDLDDVQYAVKTLENREPPLLVKIPRQPGQKEDRYAHLLSGQPDLSSMSFSAAVDDGRNIEDASLQKRVEKLEIALEELKARVDALEVATE